MQIADRKEGLVGWQINERIPLGERNLFERVEDLDAVGILGHPRAAIALDRALVEGVATSGVQRLEDALLVRGGDDQSVLRRDDQIAAGLSIATADQLIEKVRDSKVGDTREGADNVAAFVADRHRHAGYWSLRSLADRRSADRRLAVAQRALQVIAVAEVDADTVSGERGGGHRGAVDCGSESAVAEQHLQIEPLLEKVLHRRWPCQHWRGRYARHRLQRLEPSLKFALDLRGDHRHR